MNEPPLTEEERTKIYLPVVIGKKILDFQSLYVDKDEYEVFKSAWNKILTWTPIPTSLVERINSLLPHGPINQDTGWNDRLEFRKFREYVCWDAAWYVLQLDQKKPETCPAERKKYNILIPAEVNSNLDGTKEISVMDNHQQLVRTETITPGCLIGLYREEKIYHVGVSLGGDYMFHKPGSGRPEIRSLFLVKTIYNHDKQPLFWKVK